MLSGTRYCSGRTEADGAMYDSLQLILQIGASFLFCFARKIEGPSILMLTVIIG